MGPSGRITHVIGYIGYILHILDSLLKITELPTNFLVGK